jgi:hypothetical protein
LFGSVLVVLALVLGAAGASGAAAGGSGGLPSPTADIGAPVFPSTVSVAQVRAWLTRAISVRLKALSLAALSVSVARNLTAADHAALSAIITTDESGLTGLSGGLASETTLSELTETADAMVTDYRVFSLFVPQLRGVIVDERALAKAEQLAALEPSIETAITTEQRIGAGAVAAQRIYQELVVLLGAVETSMGNSVAALLALTPPNFAHAPSTFAASATALAGAITQLGAARVDVRRIAKILGGA